MIEACSFGRMVVNGKSYTSDLIIYPDGRVVDGWHRQSGHKLLVGDIDGLIQSKPEIIIAGKGVSGRMKPEKSLEKKLSRKGIHFFSAPNSKAIKEFNRLNSKMKVGACFHLTC